MNTTPFAQAAEAGVLKRMGDYVELSKPRIVLMVLVTAFVGFYLGSESVPDYSKLLRMLFGTALAAAGTVPGRCRRCPTSRGSSRPRRAS